MRIFRQNWERDNSEAQWSAETRRGERERSERRVISLRRPGTLRLFPASSHFVFLILLAAPIGVRAQAATAQQPAYCQNLADNPSDSSGPTATSPTAPSDVPARLQTDFDLVRAKSYPELTDKVVLTRTFASSADYFRTRFSGSRFLLLPRMHYFVEMNPRIAAIGPPERGVCAILAHELVHIFRMSAGNRIRLFGLVRLASAGYTARFERAADLEAIRRGYGAGLATYREWVYKNIPAKALKQKKRNYFSPEEITAILRLSAADPGLFAYWGKHVPMNLEQINGSVANGGTK
jgi:hypothetical protein